MAPKTNANAHASPRRWDALDAFRGIAVVAMIAYHFAFDLAHLGFIRADVYNDWRWIACRTAILSAFLFASGMSVALAAAHRESAAHFWGRVARIGGAAALVSIGSWFVFGPRFIWFGVLHAIAVMIVLARPLLPLRGWLIVAGIPLTAIGMAVQHPAFDHPALRWIGLMTSKPLTEDYVPLFPWFGVMLVGAGVTSLILRGPRLERRLSAWRPGTGARWLLWMGRPSLLIYLIHQPVMFGALALVASR